MYAFLFFRTSDLRVHRVRSFCENNPSTSPRVYHWRIPPPLPLFHPTHNFVVVVLLLRRYLMWTNNICRCARKPAIGISSLRGGSQLSPIRGGAPEEPNAVNQQAHRIISKFTPVTPDRFVRIPLFSSCVVRGDSGGRRKRCSNTTTRQCLQMDSK